MLQLIAIGNVGKDPEQSGNGPVRFSVACSRTYKNKQDEKVEETEWVRVTCWGKLGELQLKYLKKGRQVCVVGRPHESEYEKDGVKHRSYECIASEVHWLGGGTKAGREPGEDAPDEAGPAPVNEPGKSVDDGGVGF